MHGPGLQRLAHGEAEETLRLGRVIRRVVGATAQDARRLPPLGACRVDVRVARPERRCKRQPHGAGSRCYNRARRGIRRVLTMGARAHALAEEFRAANDDLIRAVTGYSEIQWQARCPNEGWTVAATVHHIGSGHAIIAEIVQAIATDQPLPRGVTTTREEGERLNREHAAQYAACSKEEALKLLQHNGALAASMVENLSDAQLDRVRPDFPLSAAQTITQGLVGHLRSHSESGQAATSA